MKNNKVNINHKLAEIKTAQRMHLALIKKLRKEIEELRKKNGY